ncbi:MAG: hypothetical protein K8U03_11735 [Planctomycetia bacterium]|nr:hypothetical protein [Planctomycetia bacterium]
MANQPKLKSTRRTPRTPRTASGSPEIFALLPSSRAPSAEVGELIAGLPPGIARNYESMHEILDKQTQAEMVAAYQAGMFVQSTLESPPPQVGWAIRCDQFDVVTAALGISAEYLVEALALVQKFNLPEFGVLIRRSPMTWAHLRLLVHVEHANDRRDLIERIVGENLSCEELRRAIDQLSAPTAANRAIEL